MPAGTTPADALAGLQRITIVSALPFVLVMLLMCVALVKDLRRDPLALRKRLADSVVERAIRSGVDQHNGGVFELVTKHECGEACGRAPMREPGGEAGGRTAIRPSFLFPRGSGRGRGWAGTHSIDRLWRGPLGSSYISVV